MNTIAASILGASLIIAASMLAFGRPATVPPAAEVSEVGRFTTIQHGNYLVLTDSKTGRTWHRYLSPTASSGFVSWEEESKK